MPLLKQTKIKVDTDRTIAALTRKIELQME
ncbi:MAG: hypothetical protein ACJAZP_002713 [Psychromonas sp.]|jgi:hypothetical protein